MPSFNERFKGKLKEVFLYITDRCNLHCPYCYMPESRNSDMPLNNFSSMAEKLVELGASKITFLGGEPTLHPLLLQFIETAKKMGFNYLRLDTNGQFESSFLKNLGLKSLNDICFSLDGLNAKTHGSTRMIKNYYSVTNNIEKAISLGYTVRVTTTVNSLNISQVELMIPMLEKMGVSVLNLHLVSNSGRARDNQWLLVTETEWMNFYKKIMAGLNRYKHIKIKIPRRYAKKNDPALASIVTCEAAKASRLSITPNLHVYACPLLLDKERHFAQFQKDEFVYTRAQQKNLICKKDIEGPVCPLLMEENTDKYQKQGIVPLCVSYKPTMKK